MKKCWKPNERNLEFMERNKVYHYMEFDDEYGWCCCVYAPIGMLFDSSSVHCDRAGNNKNLALILKTLTECTDPECSRCVLHPDSPIYN